LPLSALVFEARKIGADIKRATKDQTVICHHNTVTTWIKGFGHIFIELLNPNLAYNVYPGSENWAEHDEKTKGLPVTWQKP
jgi:hypothetical protein